MTKLIEFQHWLKRNHSNMVKRTSAWCLNFKYGTYKPTYHCHPNISELDKTEAYVSTLFVLVCYHMSKPLYNCFSLFCRCIVKMVSPEEIHFCDYKKCIENRRLSLRNNQKFACVHVKKVEEDLSKNLVVPS